MDYHPNLQIHLDRIGYRMGRPGVALLSCKQLEWRGWGGASCAVFPSLGDAAQFLGDLLVRQPACYGAIGGTVNLVPER
jgi:hypothetical protein